MPSTRETWIVGAVSALAGASVLGIALLGRRILPVDTVQSAPRGAPARGDVRTDGFVGTDLDAGRVEARRRNSPAAAHHVDADAEAGPRDGISARDPRKESEFYADFVAIAARDPESFERTARGALREVGPACKKVAALRALCDARSPAANDVLVAAVLELPDDSSGHAESVPGFAVRRLGLRAPRDEGARRALGGLVFGSKRPTARLRTVAAFALSAAADDVELRRIIERLGREMDEPALAASIARRELDSEAAPEAESSLEKE